MAQGSETGSATLGCPGCKRRYTVPDYAPTRRYRCSVCMVYLDRLQEPAEARRPAGGAPQADPFLGRVFGGYRLVRCLGKGGMGMVYLGERPDTGAKAAVKVLSESVSRMPGIMKRFEREGSAAARLDHPCIAATLEMGREGGCAYIVTEFVGGGSLEDLLLREKRLPPERAAAILGDVLDGLHHAHERGVVHRDVKPGNVLLTPEGRAKVIDFGLAMDAEAHSILTVTGTVMGTPSFMSPEQAKGERGGAASDQYSCGILGWYMMAGRKPFEGKGIMDVLVKQVNEPLPSLRAFNPEVPPGLGKVISRMAEKDPAKRFPSAGAAAAALRRAAGIQVSGEALPQAAAGRRLADSVWIWCLVGALAGIAAALAWRFLR